ncbi:MAG TPA: ABC transporter permease [Solirubrobacteraceae bacterium]
MAVRAATAGAATKRVLEEAGDLAVFSGRSLLALRGVPRYMSEVLRQGAMLARGTTPFLFAMAAFIGGASSNFFIFLLRSLAAEDFAGSLVALNNTRLTAIAMFGYAFAAKVGCGLVGELGSLKVNEEIDAYESEAIDPYRFVVGTRLLGGLLFLPVATAVTLFGTFVGSYVVAVPVLGAVPSSVFLDLYWNAQSVGDQIYTLFGIVATGLSILLVSCFYGLRAAGGPASVGSASARAVVVNLVMVHLLLGTFVVSFYGTDLGLPIGG